MSEGQDEVVRALQSGAAVGAPGPLRRIETHLSQVFLAPERVYKLKRAVRLPFVDFSTLAQRRAACEAETRVNRAFAPGLYLGTEPLTRGPDGAVRLGGEGEVLDWVVVMRRFPDGALFDEMARDGRLTPSLIGEAAERIALAHATADPAPHAGTASGYLEIVQGLRRAEADGAAVHGLEPGGDDLYAGLERAIGAASGLIEARRAEGRVRRGHGDLHLRNICLFEGVPTPFDALEFDPALATADVLYDLAFLLMDLRRRGLDGLANTAMNRYWDAAGESEPGLALLPAFMALRAAVRTAVAMEAGKPGEAREYRCLGLELLERRPPRLLAIGGLSGSGKSAVARAIAADLPGVCGARLLRTDVIRKAGRAQGGPLDAAAYVPSRRAEVYRAMAARAAEALAAGCPVLADATFQAPEAPAGIRAAAGDARFDALWLRASKGVRLARVGGRSGDASDADAVVAAAQAEPGLEPGWRIIDADGPLEAVVAACRDALGLRS